ncbi:MAG TPA: hypothetical protein VEB40_12570 [Flavipsychrobacter sp.]|nr:hypothetical protein [Flavipsychrobacter sp.]
MYKANHERYKLAEQLYCYADKSIPDIAELTGIPLRTLYKRAQDYKWTTLRRASKRSPAILCEEMYRELSDLTASINSRPEGQRIPTPQEANLRSKILASIKAIKKFPTHAEAAMVMQGFIRYVSAASPQFKMIIEHVENFLGHRDCYGYASFQPEHGEDLNMLTMEERSGDCPYMEYDMTYTPPDEEILAAAAALEGQAQSEKEPDSSYNGTGKLYFDPSSLGTFNPDFATANPAKSAPTAASGSA